LHTSIFLVVLLYLKAPANPATHERVSGPTIIDPLEASTGVVCAFEAMGINNIKVNVTKYFIFSFYHRHERNLN